MTDESVIEAQRDAALFSAFVRAQRKFGPAIKKADNKHLKTRYADLSSCVDAIIDGLHAEGFAFTQYTEPDETHILIRTVLIHESGGILTLGELKMPVFKNDAHGWGASLTYCRRYSILTAFGLAPEDDDGNYLTNKQTLTDIETFEKHINAINAAENEQDLFKAYKDGIKATANDPISQKRIIAVKDERKKALGVE
jgi:hypothetical protein